MSSVSNYIIDYRKTCKDAMRQIDSNDAKILFIVDSKEKIVQWINKCARICIDK